MYPFISILGKNYPSYSIMGVLGLILSILLIYFLTKKLNRDFSDYIYTFAFGIIGMLIGAKALYLLIETKSIIYDLKIGISILEFLYKYINSGMVFYGGLFGGIIGAYLESKNLKLDFKDMYLVLVPSISLFAGIGRIGCYLMGCCYGKETESILGVIYEISLNAPNGIKLLPVQLFEAAFEFAFALFVLVKLTKIKEEKILDFYLISYSVFRFLNEFMRGDEERGIFLSLSTSQWISIVIILYELFKFFFLNRTNCKTERLVVK